MYSSSPNSMPLVSEALVSSSCEFEFSTRLGTIGSSLTGSMISIDKLFLNSQIRPMKLSSHLQRHQVLAPLLDLNENEDDCENVMNEFDKSEDLKSSAKLAVTLTWRFVPNNGSSLATNDLERNRDAKHHDSELPTPHSLKL
ncbi:Protein CELLULOSE SYNTHASE INTERACTIVE 1 [Camellia lanceoleosa]|uniref:Protein CELLULOSE SYNTHASE INTERACTIVE 1 n=1 Tax=Camellia lanceoleosa TaxID=1840588 RepID=A0ACC0IWH4_9ERIC|nr:Protein CELLULOSE SYNTHASE INTERACTIVE 1 [Camellia lanceoleosa]